MKRILIDTNIFLDVMVHREPFYATSLCVLNSLKENYIACITATTITDLYYIIRKQKGHKAALEIVRQLVTNEQTRVLTVDQETILCALESEVLDFEDAVQTAAALLSQVDIIVTRNIRDYLNSPVKTLSPDEFLQE